MGGVGFEVGVSFADFDEIYCEGHGVGGGVGGCLGEICVGGCCVL